MQLPPAVERAALLTALEGVALVALAVVLAVLAAAGDARQTGSGEALAGLVGLFGAGLLLGARGLHRRSRWARGPVMAVQLLGGLTAVSLLSTRQWPAGAAVLVLALLVVSQVLAPSAREALDGPG